MTVIIPTYNRSWGLRRAVDSVLAQRFTDFELLIVDDASTDDTPAVVRSFPDPRIRYFRQPHNFGVARNWGTGLEQAQGEFVALLMDDDRYEASFLDRRVGALRSHAAAVLVYGGYRVIGENDESLKVHLPSRPTSTPFAGAELLQAALAQECFIGSTMYRTDVVRRIWRDAETAGIIVDHALNVLCSLQADAAAVYVGGLDLVRLEHDGQLSYALRDEVFHETIRFYRSLLRQPQPQVVREQLRKQTASGLVQGARKAAACANDREAITRLMRAATLDPLSRGPWTQLIRVLSGVYDSELKSKRASHISASGSNDD